MKLESFKERNHKKIGIIIFTFVCIFLVTGIVLYRAFAIFQVDITQNIMNGTIEEPGDIYFAFYKKKENGEFKIQKEMPRKEEGYILDENQSYCGITGAKDDNIKVSENEDEIIYVSGVTTSRTKCNLYFVKGGYILGKGVPFETSNDGLYEVNHDELTGTINDTGFQKTEYRYAGANPDNYLTFNNETWRIIGLVNVMTDESTIEQRVKIIKNESIGSYSWYTSSSSINSGYGINEWSEANIMKLLNPGYDNESINNSLYWNGKNGTCYKSYKNYTLSCDFQNLALSQSNFAIADNIVWNLGSNGNNDYWSINTQQLYELERSSNNGKICTSNDECNDEVKRTTTWKGKVGLIYPSDYNYATKKSSCFLINESDWQYYSDCLENNWLNKKVYEWLLTPVAYSSKSHMVYSTRDVGDFSAYGAGNSHEVRPALYLKSSMKITSGLGTEEKPFILSKINIF